MCLIPDGDLWAALHGGKARIVTDRIERFDAGGLRLKSGERLDADIVVTATGLDLVIMGAARMTVDGEAVDPSTRFTYKGCMLSGVPNFALTFGYTNASWTLKADLTAEYVCRLLAELPRQHADYAVPVVAGELDAEPFLDFTSGYVQRALAHLPKQGSAKPWKLNQNYAKDLGDAAPSRGGRRHLALRPPGRARAGRPGGGRAGGGGVAPAQGRTPAVTSPSERRAAAFAKTREAHQTEVAEDYVELIADLIAEVGEARLTDIALNMAVSAATASKIITRLRREGLVDGRPYRSVFLTDAGAAMARESHRRHGVVLDFLLALGVGRATAEADSEGMEPHVSDVTLDALAALTAHLRRELY